MAGLVIDGRTYEVPTLDTFTIGEGRVLKRYTGMTLNQLDGIDNSDPDLIAALIHVAFQRAEPDKRAEEIERAVNDVRFAQIDLQADEETEVLPPATPGSSNGAASISGDAGSNDGDPSPAPASRDFTGTAV